MESQKTTPNTDEKPGDSLGGAIIGGLLVGFAIYGLYKLVSSESQQRRSIAEHREADYIKEILGKE